MAEIYKVRHIPTGYFIQPSNDGNRNSNIGKRGKVYEGNNIWSRIQHQNEYHTIVVHQDYSIYKELAEKFPEYIKESYLRRGQLCFRMHAEPKDFEKVLL